MIQSLNVLRDMSGDSDSVCLCDIYNHRAEMRRELLNSRLLVQAMLFDAPERFLLFDKHEDLVLKQVAFFHKDSLQLLRQNNEVIILDATYKVNRFQLPMVNLVSMNSTNRMFYVGGAFMRETKDNFIWILRILLQVFELLILMDLTCFLPATLIANMTL